MGWLYNAKPHLVSDLARALKQASHGLTNLKILVRYSVLGP